MKTFLVYLLAAFLLAGCSVVEGDDDPSRREFEDNRAQWQAQGLASYEYELLIGCFCQYVGPVLVRVLDGVVQRLGRLDSTAVPIAEEDLRPNYALTIEDLFAIIDDALERADELEVDYHARLHYPTRISIDYEKRAVDDEINYRAAGLQPLR